ncbi:MAG: OadG family protein [Treponema sp.]|nr:OadG family protein [Treponema sp.]
MTITEMMGQSGILTLLGMAVVFFFLVVLVLAMYALHAVVHALKLDTEEPPKKIPTNAAPARGQGDAGAAVAAIVAAIHTKE